MPPVPTSPNCPTATGSGRPTRIVLGVLALPDAIKAALPTKREELCRIVVQPSVRAQPAARSDRLDARGTTVLGKRTAGVPQGDSGTRPMSFEDSLAWYAA